MKLLVTGANGQVGRALMSQCSEKIKIVGLDRSSLDVTDREAVHGTVFDHKPDLVVNAAAYTDVDGAEEDRDRAFKVNRDAAGYLAKAANATGSTLIHISTDYVFDGTKGVPYLEEDEPAPLSVYGMSKLEGERAVRSQGGRHVILRTARVFSEHGGNFVRTMVRLAQERDEMRVVSDQSGNPTAAADVAQAILYVAIQVLEKDEGFGTYHFAGRPAVSWFEFAQAIVKEARELLPLRVNKLIPVSGESFGAAAARPTNAELDTEKFTREFGLSAPHWKRSLGDVLQLLATGGI